VFVGRCAETVNVNRGEIIALRWIRPEALQAEMLGNGAERFTPWFVLEWKRIWRDHRSAVLALH
jgi:isopentenyldiphosphate isomerase